MQLPCSLVSLVCLSIIALNTVNAVVHEKRDIPIQGVENRQRIEKHALLPMRIGLRQNQHAELNADKWLMDVSDPLSSNYGRHWSQDEVIQAFKPSQETVNNATAWLHSHGIFDFTHTDNKMWFAFDTSVAKAESILQTEYFEHETEEGDFEASCDYYHLPQFLQPHVHFITPGIKTSDINGRTARSRFSLRKRMAQQSATIDKRVITPDPPPPFNSSTNLEHCGREVTPACIRQLYNFSIPDQTLPVNPNNSMGIFADEDLYWQGDLNLLYRYFAPQIPAGTAPIFAPIDHAARPPNVTRGRTWNLVSGEAGLDLSCSLPIIYPQTATFFDVGSNAAHGNGFPANYQNRFLSAIDGSYCSAAQRGNSSEGGKPQCGVYKPTNVISFSYGLPEHIFSRHWKDRQCNEYLKLGLQGVSIFFCTQDHGVGELGQMRNFNGNLGFRCDANNGTGPRMFMPEFPASCPYVTAVGATEIHPGNTVFDPEIGAEWTYYYNGSHYWNTGVATGGGFSLTFDAPSYQKEAVGQFFDNHDPPWPYFYNGNWQNSTGRYNRNGRGFPDISAIGTRIATFFKDQYGAEIGTSASTPIVAALFNRIIEERLRVGKGPVGFVNPTLYQHPEALNDIIYGKNGFCHKDDGFTAAPGWDPVTGLGTPDYGKLLDIFMNLP